MKFFILFLFLLKLTKETKVEEHEFTSTRKREMKSISHVGELFKDRVDQLHPTGDGNEISGCTFKNIYADSTTMNNFIKAEGPVLFYDNIFESDTLGTKQPGVMWYNWDSKLSIVNCSFIRHNTQSTTDAHILTIDSDNHPEVTFESCKFIDCSSSETKTLVQLKSDQCIITFTNCMITFDEPSKSCKIIKGVNPKVTFDKCDINKPGQNAIELQMKSNTLQGEFKFTNNVVKNVKSNFIDLTQSRASFVIDGNSFENVTLNNEYFIHIVHVQSKISLNYNNFAHFTSQGTDELRTGGISTFFQNLEQGTYAAYSLNYDHCTFVDIKNERQTNSAAYGGAIHFGFGNYLSSLTINISNCVFNENKAYMHGGALAIQTESTVFITNCTFENNFANTKSSASSSLLEDKIDGKGGAIYLNPSFTQNNADKIMIQATIENCKFIKNSADGGYAIYIDGKEDATTSFSITNNKFFSNHNGKGGECTHAAIDSEVHVLDKQKIENENEFSTLENGSGSKLIIFVDHSGNLLPDPTSTPRATHPPTPEPTEGTVNNFIDKVFVGRNFTSQIRPGNTRPEDGLLNVKQVSGCTFKNIEKINNDMNNFIQVLGDSLFFNNTIENDEVQSDEPGVIWLNSNINFTIYNCKFIRATSRYSSGDANILTVDFDNSPTVTFDSCEFIDCAYMSDESLVKFKNQEPVITFTNCIILFSQTGCQIVQSMNPQVVFDHCQITGCVSNAINLGSIPSGSTKKGQFKFTNNIVKKQTDTLINIANLNNNAFDISNNLFEDVTLNDQYMIHIQNSLKTLQLSYNTFSRITTSANSEKYSGGFACFMPTSAKTSATSTVNIIYDNCNFYDIQNLYSKKPYYQGGAVQCGFSKDLTDISLKITNCVFKRNQAYKHGGAVAIQIQGTITIKNCTFEENRANCKSSTAKLLLYEDNTDKKEEGRGGAIYINPTFVVENDDKFSMKITIDNCTFKRNAAYDGYAIYIEGENDGSTIYDIKNNIFFDNFDGQSSSNGGVFVSEVTRISQNQVVLDNNNVFSNIDYGVGAYPFYHADHSGVRLPDPTQTPFPTKPENPYEEDWIQTEKPLNERCVEEKDPLVESERHVVINVKASKFSDMKEINGSAIHLVNCGLSCTDKCEFNNCGNDGSVGGAVYIYNANELLNDVNMYKLTFTSCHADYGGAVFIYSSSDINTVTIKSCTFEQNVVKENGPSDILTGGSAMFLSIKSGQILYCKFSLNIGPGGSVKLLNDVESQTLLLDRMNPTILLKDCTFDEMKESIFYVAKKDGSTVEVTNCAFNGKLNKGAHHIDGMVIDKVATKMIIKSCKFNNDDIRKVVPKNCQFASVDVKSLDFETKNNDSLSSWKSAALIAVPAVAVVIVVLVIILKRNNSIVDNEDELNENENENIEHDII